MSPRHGSPTPWRQAAPLSVIAAPARSGSSPIPKATRPASALGRIATEPAPSDGIGIARLAVSGRLSKRREGLAFLFLHMMFDSALECLESGIEAGQSDLVLERG